jgi:hypothetical protein
VAGVGQPAGVAALVAFGLPARAVDDLIEGLQGTDVEPARWFVFDSDMQAMAALHEFWKGTVDVVMCCVPSLGAHVAAAALEILHNEDVPLDRCAWLHAAAHYVDGVDGMGFVMTVAADADSLLHVVKARLLDWQGEVLRRR